ncbi:cysteine proteinase [Lentinula aciculospora]|uniref:Ubiquitin carboxyl-terminal hydrolase n=1 Tax=Lentinula aciculospora TaxID=153920 RepID=A0A9W9AEM7_9AGAR|nr:cysteine proteinase [Lentinula aciculospora]
MLASPLYLSAQPNHFPSSKDDRQYRPAKDIDAFNSLLPPPIEFVEGSSSDALAVTEGKYEPINVTPKRITQAERTESHDKANSEVDSSSATSTAPSQSTPAPKANPKTRPLFTGDIDLSWPRGAKLGSGLHNTGNTCFLNSAIQCLVHTPPLLHLLVQHTPEKCPCKNNFCMTCSLRTVAMQSHRSNNAFSPSQISGKLQVIAKHMRRGRQEDSHEFLRYAIDALQKSCLAGQPPKIDHELAETTWVHKLFGGKLRSRVTCESCGHNSDTFDSILDLSLDIHHSQLLKDALRKFVAPDHLKGADKYKCEKCKKHVNATKKFSIHDAPVVLTVHLKRFSPMGSKIGHMVSYDEQLSLGPYMSEGQYGPNYSLYGVICHAGGGPHSGHYYAYVRSRENRWYEMNDDLVTTASTPTRNKNSYILFYIKNKGEKLESAVKVSNTPLTNGSALSFTPTQVKKPGLVAQMQKKRPREEQNVTGDEDQGVKLNSITFIGPLLPSSLENTGESSPSQAKRPKLDSEDPQASVIKQKIDSAKAATSKTSLLGLVDYGSDNNEEDVGEKAEKPEESSSNLMDRRESLPPRRPTPATATPKASFPVPTNSFYATPPAKQRPSFGGGSNGPSPANCKTPSLDRKNGYNPYSFGKKNKKFSSRPRGI